MKICKCCQRQQTGEERHTESKAKRGSIVESRTSIKAEITNSSNKVSLGFMSVGAGEELRELYRTKKCLCNFTLSCKRTELRSFPS